MRSEEAKQNVVKADDYPRDSALKVKGGTFVELRGGKSPNTAPSLPTTSPKSAVSARGQQSASTPSASGVPTSSAKLCTVCSSACRSSR